MKEIGPQQQNQHKPRVTNELRQLIFQEMLSLKVSDSLSRGTFKRIAQKYGYTHRTIRDLWKRAIQTKEANKIIHCGLQVQKLWKKKSGRTTKLT